MVVVEKTRPLELPLASICYNIPLNYYHLNPGSPAQCGEIRRVTSVMCAATASQPGLGQHFSLLIRGLKPAVLCILTTLPILF